MPTELHIVGKRQKCVRFLLGTPVRHLSALVDFIATLLVSTRKTIKELKDMTSSRLLSHPDVQLLLCAVLLLCIIYVSVMCTFFGTLSFRKVSKVHAIYVFLYFWELLSRLRCNITRATTTAASVLYMSSWHTK